MYYFIILLVSFFVDTVDASVQYQNYALSNCAHPNSEIGDSLDHYIYLTKNSGSQYHVNECEDAIVKKVFENFNEKIYLEKLGSINEKAKTHPVDMCVLDIAIRAEWERLYLPLLNTEYFKEFNSNNATSNIYTSLMPLLIFSDITSRSRIAKIGHLLARLALMSYITKETVTNRDLLLLKQNRFSSPDIPIDPALVLDCPATGSLRDGLEASNLYALGQMLETEVISGLSSMGINVGILGVIKMIQRAKAIKNINTASKVTKSGFSLGAILGPQALLFAGSIVAYEGAEAGIKHYINTKKRNSYESELQDQIKALDRSVKRLQSLLKDMPDNFYSLNLNTYSGFKTKINEVEEQLEKTYLQSRQVMEGVYNLIGFYNAPVIEKSMELNAKLKDIQTFGNDFRNISWIETAHSKIRTDLSQGDENYTSYREFQKQTNSTNIDAGKVVKAYLKWQGATNQFDSDVSTLRTAGTTCSDSHRYDIYKIGLIEMLKNQKISAVNKLYSSLGSSNLEVMDEVSKLASEMVTKNYTTNGEILKSIYRDIDQRIVTNMPVYQGLDLEGIQNKHANNVMNRMRLRLLERDIKKSNKVWYDSFRQGDFCRDSSSLLYQASQYFLYLHLRMHHLYKNKMRVGFFDNFSKRLHAEVSKNESFEEDMKNKMYKGFEAILKKQNDKRPHGGAL